MAVISSTGRVDTKSIVATFKSTFASRAEIELTVVRSSDEGTRVAHEAARHARVVAAVGGDGTVADVASGLFGSRAALGIVPNGSTNITARSLGIPAMPARAIALLAGRHDLRRIDVGRAGDRSFLHIAGAGIDAEIFSRAQHAWKRRLGWLAYLPPALAAVSLSPSTIHLSADDQEIEARSPLVLVANGGSVLVPEFRLFPGIAPDDGWLDLLLFTPTTRTEMISLLARAGQMRLDRSPLVRRWRVKRVRIEADPPLPVQLDGDARGSTPREFAIVPAGTRVVTPPASHTTARAAEL